MLTIKSLAEDGTDLYVRETGNPQGRPVLFIHGFSQSHESWTRQMDSVALQHDLRMIAFDLRGHGDSDKPLTQAAYHDPKRWAFDVQSVIRATGVQRPCVVAWSYGGRVLNDYLSVFGDAGLGALNYVAATSTTDKAGHGRSHGLIAPMLSEDAATAEAATGAFLKACFERQPTATELEHMTRYNAKAPVAVRKLLTGRPANYDDTFRRVKVPVLITHGSDDQISALAMSEHTQKMIVHSQLSVYQGSGHSPFFEDPQRFNAELLNLARRTTP
jgi:non-heme chloroperoxidase